MLPRMNKIYNHNLVWSHHRIFCPKIFQSQPPTRNPRRGKRCRCLFCSRPHGPGCTAACGSSAASDVSRLLRSMPLKSRPFSLSSFGGPCLAVYPTYWSKLMWVKLCKKQVNHVEINLLWEQTISVFYPWHEIKNVKLPCSFDDSGVL